MHVCVCQVENNTFKNQTVCVVGNFSGVNFHKKSHKIKIFRNFYNFNIGSQRIMNLNMNLLTLI